MKKLYTTNKQLADEKNSTTSMDHLNLTNEDEMITTTTEYIKRGNSRRSRKALKTIRRTIVLSLLSLV